MDSSEHGHEAPRVDPYAPPAVGSANYSYRSIDTLCTVITVSMALLSFAYIGISMCETIGGVLYPNFSDPNAEVSSDSEMMLALGVFGLALFAAPLNIAAVIAVCMFMHRANGNVRVFGATGLQFTPGWSVGYWFIPILNLFKPYQAMREIFTASENPVGDSRQSVVVPGVFTAWWATWMIGSAVSRVETRMAVRGMDAGGMAIPLTWTSTILMVIAAVSLISIVRGINQRQSDWMARSGEGTDGVEQVERFGPA